MSVAAEHRRELRRRILETMASMRGHGWATASDIVDRLNPADGLQHRDGRRVAGQLRKLARERHVERLDQRDFREVTRDGYRTEDLVGPVLEYRITDAGLEHLDDLAARFPRLTDAPGRPWPRKRHRTPTRQRHR